MWNYSAYFHFSFSVIIHFSVKGACRNDKFTHEIRFSRYIHSTIWFIEINVTMSPNFIVQYFCSSRHFFPDWNVAKRTSFPACMTHFQLQRLKERKGERNNKTGTTGNESISSLPSRAIYLAAWEKKMLTKISAAYTVNSYALCLYGFKVVKCPHNDNDRDFQCVRYSRNLSLINIAGKRTKVRLQGEEVSSL